MPDVLILIAGIVIVAAAIAIAVVMSRRSRLRPLSNESKVRYAESWRRIEARFIEDPATAVREADSLSASVLGERGANLTEGRALPEDLAKAREAVGAGGGTANTEGRRIAMLHYKRIVDDAVGGAALRRSDAARPEAVS